MGSGTASILPRPMRFAFSSLALLSGLAAAAALFACVSDTGAVTPVTTSDAAPQSDSGSSPAPDAGADVQGTDGGSLPGDVIDLDESTLSIDENEMVVSWADRQARATFRPTGGSAPGAVAPAPQAPRCARFAVGVDSLLAKETDVIDFSGDFSVTLKLVRGAPALGRDDGAIPFSKARIDVNEPHRNFAGFGLMSDYQIPSTGEEAVRKFAGRFDYFLGQSATDLPEPTVRAGDAKFVVTFAKSAGNGRLLVRQAGEAATDITRGSGLDAVAAPQAPMILGSARPDPDDATKFDGLLCAVVVHVGAETDDDLKNRIEKLKW